MWNIRKLIKKGIYDYALVPEHPKATANGYVLYHRVVMENSIKVEKAQEELGEIRNIGSKEVGESPEEKAQKEQERKDKIEAEAKKKAKLAIFKAFQTQLSQIKDEIGKGKTLDDVINEINEKKSTVSRSTRDFCLNFEKDAILGYIKEFDVFRAELKKLKYK